MENPNENDDSKLDKQIISELSRKSVEIKKKNDLVTEKLRTLKKQTDELLKADPVSKR